MDLVKIVTFTFPFTQIIINHYYNINSLWSTYPSNPKLNNFIIWTLSHYLSSTNHIHYPYHRYSNQSNQRIQSLIYLYYHMHLCFFIITYYGLLQSQTGQSIYKWILVNTRFTAQGTFSYPSRLTIINRFNYASFLLSPFLLVAQRPKTPDVKLSIPFSYNFLFSYITIYIVSNNINSRPFLYSFYSLV